MRQVTFWSTWEDFWREDSLSREEKEKLLKIES